MDLPNPDGIITKMEPETTGEGGGALSHSNMLIDVQDIKEEGLEYPEKCDSTAGKKIKSYNPSSFSNEFQEHQFLEPYPFFLLLH